jgi:hypothetical protein
MDEDDIVVDVMQKAIMRANIDYPGLEGGRRRDPVLRDSEDSRHLALAALNGLHKVGFKVVLAREKRKGT